MQIAIAGGGPVGIFTAMSLARRGHDVVVVDRDPGPAPDGQWVRAGVMQFQHPHGYRGAVRHALRAELPDVYDALLAAGAEVRPMPGLPEAMAGLWCRRSVVEQTLRAAAQREPRLRWLTGHVDRVIVEHDTARGLVVDGVRLEADLTVVATGRASRLGAEFRGRVEGGPCGFSYISRMYEARAGQPGCDLCAPLYPIGPGYYSMVMPQDAGTHSLLLCYPAATLEFAALRTNAGFDRAVAAIPALAPFCDSERFAPLTDVLVGGNLTNTYRLQGPALGLPPARGLFFLGDAIATFNPIAGRYLGLALQHAQQLLAALDEPGQDVVDRIPSDVICAAAAVDPSIRPFVGMYLGMVAGPDVLDPAEGRVRALLEGGWRPALVGPTAAELTTLIAA
jgi:2-polyprenyl-6-methoxyphenol hydroxylase-like FAD-dependent oxidoreductase